MNGASTEEEEGGREGGRREGMQTTRCNTHVGENGNKEEGQEE